MCANRRSSWAGLLVEPAKGRDEATIRMRRRHLGWRPAGPWDRVEQDRAVVRDGPDGLDRALAGVDIVEYAERVVVSVAVLRVGRERERGRREEHGRAHVDEMEPCGRLGPD